MQTELRQESPLVGAGDLLDGGSATLSEQIRLCELPFLELNNIRGNASDPDFRRAISEVIGVDLPVRANTVSEGPGYVLWWLGPDEWLAQSHDPMPARLDHDLRVRFGDLFATTVDVSSGYTTLRLSGSRVSDVLNKGCPLDLHPRVFKPGQCAQSHFFKTAIALRKLVDGTWHLIVRRSFADYATRMLVDASAEYGP
ncbi:MAG TPA: sarcosine oxidase subunit gamma family protein [Burkholderiaceae bacterium]|nr:sarcosine oxidase subunit gamma family protein [Burkholderiaceae bacterium]